MSKPSTRTNQPTGRHHDADKNHDLTPTSEADFRVDETIPIEGDAGAHRDTVASVWAEEQMTLHPDSPNVLRGAAAAAHGRALLEAALGGPAGVERAVRGRKTLGQGRPAGRSPKRQVTVPADLDERALAYIGTGAAADYSALMRAALTEYLEHHRPQSAVSGTTHAERGTT